MPATLDQVADRFAVEDVLRAYGVAIDRKDWPALRRCFTDDATALYAGQQEALRGGDAIVTWIAEMTRRVPWQHHFITVPDVRLDGDTARTTSYLVSSQRTDDEPAVLVRMLGAYTDTVRRTAEGWRIAERELRLGWAEHQHWPDPPVVAPPS